MPWSCFGGLRKGVGYGNVPIGAVNPSGHLTSTWYQNVNSTDASDIPVIDNYNINATVTITGELDGHAVSTEFVAYVVASTNLDGITVNGAPMELFARDRYCYKLSTKVYRMVIL